MEQAKIVHDFQDDAISCPRCQSINYIKDGKRKNGQQGYRCKKCDKRFVENNALNNSTQDSDGDWWIDCTRSKVFKESRLFIPKELAIKIQEEQSYIRNKFQTNFNNLFCTTKHRSWFNQYGLEHQNCSRKELNWSCFS